MAGVLALGLVASTMAMAPAAPAQTTPPDGPLAAATATSPDVGASASCSLEEPCSDRYALALWADVVGWDQPQYYGAVRVADINGNGRPDLVGKGPQGLEVFEQSADEGTCGRANQPVNSTQPFQTGCGTWLPLVPTMSGYGLQSSGAVSAASDLLLTGNIDQDPNDEILVGNGTNILVIDAHDPGTGYPTLSVSAIGPAIDLAGTFDSSVWSSPEYRSAITLADVDGDGADELLARSKNGFWIWDYAAGAFGPPHGLLGLDDAGGYNQSEYYDPVLAGNVDGVTGDELLLRGADGLNGWSYDPTTGGWNDLPTFAGLRDGDGPDGPGLDGTLWYQDGYRETIQLADIDGDGDDEVLARGATHLWSIDYAGGAWATPVQAAPWGDAQGFASPALYSTIRPIELGELVPGADGMEVLASNGTAFESWTYDPATTTWSKVPQDLPLPTTADWTQDRYYRSLWTTPASDVAGNNLLVHRDPLGVRSYSFDAVDGWSDSVADFPDFSEPDLAAAYAALNAYVGKNGGNTIRAGYDDNATLSSDATSVSAALTLNPPPDGVTLAAWTTVTTQIDNEIRAAQALQGAANDAGTVIDGTFGVAENMLLSAQTELSAPKSNDTRFKWGSMVADFIGAIGGGVALKLEKSWISVATSFAVAGGATIDAGTDFGIAKGQQSSQEKYYGQLEGLETQLSTRFQSAEAYVQDLRASVVFNYGNLMSVYGLLEGPWAYDATDLAYLQAAGARSFEMSMWNGAATAADWRVYVCTTGQPGSWEFPSDTNADAKRTHCDTDDKYAHGRVYLQTGNQPADWIIDKLEVSGNLPPIAQPDTSLLEKLYTAPAASCDTVWVSGKLSSGGCAFGLDMTTVYMGQGVWNLSCETYYQHGGWPYYGAKNKYDPPCDRFVVGPDCKCDMSDYSDVAVGHPFYQAIFAITDIGVVGGYDDGTFRPGATVTRQAMASFLYELAGSPDMSGVDDGFGDIDEGHPFRDAIAWMHAEGISEGYDDGTFRPILGLTRQAAAAYLFRLAGEPDPSAWPTLTFDDVPDDHPFADAIRWMVGARIARGYPDGTFRPGAILSRQAMASFLLEFKVSAWI